MVVPRLPADGLPSVRKGLVEEAQDAKVKGKSLVYEVKEGRED